LSFLDGQTLLLYSKFCLSLTVNGVSRRAQLTHDDASPGR